MEILQIFVDAILRGFETIQTDGDFFFVLCYFIFFEILSILNFFFGGYFSIGYECMMLYCIWMVQ